MHFFIERADSPNDCFSPLKLPASPNFELVRSLRLHCLTSCVSPLTGWITEMPMPYAPEADSMSPCPDSGLLAPKLILPHWPTSADHSPAATTTPCGPWPALWLCLVSPPRFFQVLSHLLLLIRGTESLRLSWSCLDLTELSNTGLALRKRSSDWVAFAADCHLRWFRLPPVPCSVNGMLYASSHMPAVPMVQRRILDLCGAVSQVILFARRYCFLLFPALSGCFVPAWREGSTWRFRSLVPSQCSTLWINPEPTALHFTSSSVVSWFLGLHVSWPSFNFIYAFEWMPLVNCWS